jgi:hypothetical protein
MMPEKTGTKGRDREHRPDYCPVLRPTDRHALRQQHGKVLPEAGLRKAVSRAAPFPVHAGSIHQPGVFAGTELRPGIVHHPSVSASGYVLCPELRRNVPPEQLYALAQTVGYLRNVPNKLDPA